jgi:hypothetical protein
MMDAFLHDLTVEEPLVHVREHGSDCVRNTAALLLRLTTRIVLDAAREEE